MSLGPKIKPMDFSKLAKEKSQGKPRHEGFIFLIGKFSGLSSYLALNFLLSRLASIHVI